MRDVRGAPVKRRVLVAATLALGLMGAAKAPPPGVSPSEIVVGTHLDLSGPLSELGIAVRNGLVTAFDEVNAAGGIHGRKLRLIAADDGYSARKAVTVTRLLLHRDHIFAMLCPIGTPPVAATMPLVLNSGTLHLFPFTSADDTYVPMQVLEFAIDLPAARQIAIGVHALAQQSGALKVGVLYRSDALGQSALRGAMAALARERRAPAATASFAPGTVNFEAQLASLRDAGSELVVVGGVAQEAITAMQQAAAQGWFPVFLCGSACYVPELPALGGRAVSGLYVVATTPIPYPDDKDARLRDWVKRYERRFGTVASVAAFRAYLDARVFAEALRRAGPGPTERLVAHMLEAMSPWKDPEFGGVPVVFTPRDHVGFRTGFLAQVRNGRWTTLTDAVPAPSPHH
jgi:branched-chain amino acid transport system substrate-binding protein